MYTDNQLEDLASSLYYLYDEKGEHYNAVFRIVGFHMLHFNTIAAIRETLTINTTAVIEKCGTKMLEMCVKLAHKGNVYAANILGDLRVPY